MFGNKLFIPYYILDRRLFFYIHMVNINLVYATHVLPFMTAPETLLPGRGPQGMNTCINALMHGYAALCVGWVWVYHDQSLSPLLNSVDFIGIVIWGDRASERACKAEEAVHRCKGNEGRTPKLSAPSSPLCCEPRRDV